MGVLDRNGELNSLELKAECDKQGSLVTVNGYTGIVEVLQGDEVGNPAYLAEVIQTKRKHRQLILMGEKLMQRCIAEEGQPDDVIAEFSAGLADVASRNSRRSSIPLSEIVIEAQHGHPFSPQGHSAKAGVFGIDDLDQIAYIPIGEPTLIAARPGVGKTALAVQSAFRSASMGAKVLFVSMELTEERLKARFAAYLTGVSAKVWLDGTYTHDQANLLAQHQQTLDNIRVISPDQGIPWPTLEAEIRLNIHKHQTNLVFIDYFGFIGITRAKDENMAYSSARVMASITALCKNAQIGMVVLCQLTKDATNRGSKKPTLTELADTDRPARDAALTLMLYQLNDGTQTWISIAKNRSGRTDYDKLVEFCGMTNRFTSIVRYTD
jgi:replicative DNA helicase